MLGSHKLATGTSLLSFHLAVRYFLKNKVSPDLCNEDGLTALHQVSRPLWGPLASLLPKSSGKRGRETGAQRAQLEGFCPLEMPVSVTDRPSELLGAQTHTCNDRL